jgi:hypothetical protein
VASSKLFRRGSYGKKEPFKKLLFVFMTLKFLPAA